jgi:hypothetical protein
VAEIKSVTVVAPSRLHFGMFSFGVPNTRQFGGAGVMIDRPSTTIRIEPAAKDECIGVHADRLKQTLELIRASAWSADVPTCKLMHVGSPRSHVGLGSGTQTALAVVAGLRAFAGLPPLEALDLGEASRPGSALRVIRPACMRRSSLRDSSSACAMPGCAASDNRRGGRRCFRYTRRQNSRSDSSTIGACGPTRTSTTSRSRARARAGRRFGSSSRRFSAACYFFAGLGFTSVASDGSFVNACHWASIAGASSSVSWTYSP